jgi:protocatechuate 3,4-dioxygenase beta subunit
VTFSIATGPTGASASFLGGGAQTTASTKSDGLATSPPLVANASPGRFTAAASTTDLPTPATFNLSNHAAAETLATVDTAPQEAAVGTRYPRPLRARVLDAGGQPIEGVTVTFTLPQTSSGAGATFLGGSNQATLGGSNQATDVTAANGRASSPPLLANSTAGRFTATATATATGSAKPFSYVLRNLAGKPATITPGAADGETTPAGTRFPIRLAVTVKDANSNPVAGALVTFTAPAGGPSGRFNLHGRASRIVGVKTNAQGIAIAPAFTANDTPGGYVVIATANGQRVGFALVNDPRQ